MRKKIELPVLRKRQAPQSKGLLKFAAPAFVVALAGKLAIAKIAAKVFEKPSFRSWLKSDDKSAANFREERGHLAEAPTQILVGQISLQETLTLLGGYWAATRALSR